MSGVADPNESQRDHRTQQAAGTDPDSAEIVEAEIVDDEPPRSSAAGSASAAREPRTGPADDEEFRQYQQFLEFQRFQEWQRQQGSGGADTSAGSPWPSGPAAPEPEQRRPWWRRALRLLRYKFVRRLLYLLIVLLVLYYLVSSMLASFTGGGGSGDSSPGTGGAPPNASPQAPDSPDLVIYALYNYIGGQSPEQACALFTDSGKAAFAAAGGTPDCPSAARKARAAVTDPGAYRDPMFLSALQETGSQTLVNSCAMQVSGGPALGTMRISRQADGGWQIDQYENPRC